MADDFAVMGFDIIELVAVNKAHRLVDSQPLIDLGNHSGHEVSPRIGDNIVVDIKRRRVGKQCLGSCKGRIVLSGVKGCVFGEKIDNDKALGTANFVGRSDGNPVFADARAMMWGT